MNYPAEAVSAIATGKYVVMPTDTIYGIVGSALDPGVVEKLYEVRKRDRSKPFIILLADTSQLALFHIPPERYAAITEKYWPGPTSIIVPASDERVAYLHRGTNALAFRIPAVLTLRELIAQTGPLVAPSANPESFSPATTVDEAREYFGDQVPLYVDGGTITGAPSTIISIGENGEVTKMR